MKLVDNGDSRGWGLSGMGGGRLGVAMGDEDCCFPTSWPLDLWGTERQE